MNIGELIKSKRIAKGYTLDDLAKIIGVTGATISRWEAGKISDMKRSRIQALSDALDIPVMTILGIEEKKPDDEYQALLRLAAYASQQKRLKAYLEKYFKMTTEHQIAVQSMIDFLYSEEQKEKESASSKEA